MYKKTDIIKLFQITESRYTPLVRHYLEYVKHLSGEIRDPYTGFHFYLTDMLGIAKKDADEELAYFMNAVRDAMD